MVSLLRQLSLLRSSLNVSPDSFFAPHIHEPPQLAIRDSDEEEGEGIAEEDEGEEEEDEEDEEEENLPNIANRAHSKKRKWRPRTVEEKKRAEKKRADFFKKNCARYIGGGAAIDNRSGSRRWPQAPSWRIELSWGWARPHYQ